MSAGMNSHDGRVERFRSDLSALRPSDVIRKYITTGSPVAITEDVYFALRSLVAGQFNLHPSAVVLVGSARTGFSIAPKKRYREARENSDLDVALVSSERFDQYWDDVFAYSTTDIAWERSGSYRAFVRMLFSGWIDPRGLPNVPRFEHAARWTNFFDNLMQSRRFGPRRITARLYRTWSRLEAYQEKAVRLQRSLEKAGPSLRCQENGL
ncbi:MAG: hypothetical protein SGJ19_23690 [Planctomycetia bacterium]|nr:hypothetical protein [Planctomycetia bacterium]